MPITRSATSHALTTTPSTVHTLCIAGVHILCTACMHASKTHCEYPSTRTPSPGMTHHLSPTSLTLPAASPPVRLAVTPQHAASQPAGSTSWERKQDMLGRCRCVISWCLKLSLQRVSHIIYIYIYYKLAPPPSSNSNSIAMCNPLPQQPCQACAPSSPLQHASRTTVHHQ